MTKAQGIVVLLLLHFGTGCQVGDGPIPPSDQLAIRQQIERYADAYRSGDAVSLGALFEESADSVSGTGRTLRGRREIEERKREEFSHHVGAHSDIRDGARFDVLSIKFVTEDVAIADVLIRLFGCGADPTTPWLQGLKTVVFARKNGMWLRVAERKIYPDNPYGVDEGFLALVRGR